MTKNGVREVIELVAKVKQTLDENEDVCRNQYQSRILYLKQLESEIC